MLITIYRNHYIGYRLMIVYYRKDAKYPTPQQKLRQINVFGSIRLELDNDDDCDLKTIQPLI